MDLFCLRQFFVQSIESIIIFMLKLGELVTTSGCICKIFSASICLFWFGPLANGQIICAWLQLEMGGALPLFGRTTHIYILSNGFLLAFVWTRYHLAAVLAFLCIFSLWCFCLSCLHLVFICCRVWSSQMKPLSSWGESTNCSIAIMYVSIRSLINRN